MSKIHKLGLSKDSYMDGNVNNEMNNNLPPTFTSTGTPHKSIDLRKMNMIIGIFLIITAVGGNFLAETLSCQSQALLSNNMYAKNILIVLLIYFSLGVADAQFNEHPFIVFLRSLAIWVFYVLFNKMDLPFTITVFSILFVILLCKNFAEYYSNKNDDDNSLNQNYKDILLSATNYLFVVACLVTITGFMLYLQKQQKDHKKTFDYITFILGKPTCKNIKISV